VEPKSHPAVKQHADIPEPILLEGKAYTLDALLEYGASLGKDKNEPEWRKGVFSFIVKFLNPQGGEISQKSSGTTGDPKSFLLTREAMLLSAERSLRYLKLRGGERALLALPIQYIAGKMMVVRALLGRLDLVLTEPSSRPLKDQGTAIDFAAMVPLQIEESLQAGDSLELVSTLIIGGGELNPDSRTKLSAMHRPRVYETFGMTETYTHFALKRINGSHPQSDFHLLEGVQIELDSRGCLEVEVKGITSGSLQTNDMVEINEAGDGFTWLGRFDNLINSGGIKIIPELMEAQVSRCIGHACIVLSEPDRKLGERLVLLVEYEGSSPPIKSWLEQLRACLFSYEIPRRVLTVNTLPRNSSMKPDRTSARNLLL
jgi:o-succinylbenzoate---CoA ligase